MRFCVSVDAVPRAIPKKIKVPKLGSDENHNDDHISADEATAFIAYLNCFEYARMDQILFKL